MFIAIRSIGTHAPTSTRTAHLPTKSHLLDVFLGVGIQLSPAHFRLAHLSRQCRCRTVRYYALLRRWLLLSLRPVCLEASVPYNFTLSWNLGALTQVSVVPVTSCQLTQHSRLLASSMNIDSEFDKTAGSFEPILSNQCSTPHSISTKVTLRGASRGTRYRNARLDFHPYTGVTKSDILEFVAALHQSLDRLQPAPV